MTYIKVVLTVIAVALVLLAWSAFVPARAQTGSMKCDGKLVPAPGFDTKTAVNPMYEIRWKCE